MIEQRRTGIHPLYENYPVSLTGPPPLPRTAGGARRGAVVGMGVAAATAVAVVPTSFDADVPVTAWIILLGFISCVAAALGAAPGALIGGLLAILARRGASGGLQRMLGGIAAAGTAAVVSMPFGLSGWPGVVVAALCGSFATPWVAWGPDRASLAR